MQSKKRNLIISVGMIIAYNSIIFLKEKHGVSKKKIGLRREKFGHMP